MEILGEMSIDSDENSEYADEELEIVPDFFVAVRKMLLQADGQPRVIVRACRPVTVLGVLIWLVMNFTIGTWKDGGRFETYMALVRYAFMGLPNCGAALYLSYVADVIRPKDGQLELLGAGVKQLPASHVRRLQRWRNLMMLPAVGVALYGLVYVFLPIYAIKAAIAAQPCDPNLDRISCQMSSADLPDPGCCYGKEEWQGHIALYFIPYCPFAVFSLCLGYPVAMMWCKQRRSDVINETTD